MTNNTFDEIVKVIKEGKKAKFDETLECQLKLTLPEKNKKDSIRFSVVFDKPFEEGKKVVVLADAQYAEEAKKAGADFVGLEDLVKKISGGWTDFDILIATPSVMAKISVLGKILGPKGLMPNPKNETVTTDLKRVIDMYKKGKLDFRADEGGALHLKFGKVSMAEDIIKANFVGLMKEVFSAVNKYGDRVITSAVIKSSMSKPYKLELTELKLLTK